MEMMKTMPVIGAKKREQTRFTHNSETNEKQTEELKMYIEISWDEHARNQIP